jgi:hypothetical protein
MERQCRILFVRNISVSLLSFSLLFCHYILSFIVLSVGELRNKASEREHELIDSLMRIPLD